MESAVWELGKRRVVIECPTSLGASIEQIQGFSPLRSWLQKLHADIEVRRVTIQSVDTFNSGSIGFVKLSSDAHFNGTRIPGVVFLRGPSTAVLLILRTQEGGRVPSRLDGGYAVMVEQPRVAAGEALLELPAGMDDGVCTAVKEVMEETGIAIEEGDLVELGAAYPSPGACDEMVTLYACEKAVTSDELERVRGRLGGCRSEGELITVRLVRISDLWQTTDMKTLAALCLWDRLQLI
ncbi:hypothetical protein IWW39_004765 [Coemansia spiralis]|uniref:Nudix hydrolase domain-containing protein n=1 Tax=Coemansia spiralis TaxID=417178 RepID=A0A9W8GFH5_9FUNG|nr:hypothetical protein IWW39_004765 [Coemansia spiralis]